MADKVYTDQALTLDVTFTDEDGDAIDITDGTVAAQLFAPSNRTVTASSTVDGVIAVAASGTATVTIPVETLDEAGQWRVQPIVTLSSTPWPGNVSEIIITERGKM